MATALVLIDIQNDYFHGGRMELEGSEEASAKARAALELFRSRKMPVIHVNHLSLRPGATFFLPGTEGLEPHESVTPRPDEPVVVKHYPNSFRETRLRDILSEIGAQRVVIAGMMTHMCVDATTRAALDLGFDCTVLHDACATRSLAFGSRLVAAQDVHAAFLAALGAATANVVGTDELRRLAGA